MFFCLGVSIAFAVNLLFAFIPYEFKANRITKPPVIDGYLNDPGWEEATRIDKDFRNYELDDPEYGKIAPVKTIVLVGYDDKNLYIGFICEEPQMNELRAKAKNQNRWWEMGTLQDDRIGVCINPYQEKTDTYGAMINANGIYHWLFMIPLGGGYLCRI